MGTKASGGQDMNCQDCHRTKDHKIAGASSMMAHFESRVACEDCHSGDKAPHRKSKNSAILARHLQSVACQTCHIPLFAKAQATKMSWKWSDAGKDMKGEEEYDKETFDKRKGTFSWGMNVKPVYRWYNGTIERYMKGQVIKDPAVPVIMTAPVGSIADATAKIYPYKYYTGDQPMDAEFKYLSVFQQYKSLWTDFDWNKALAEGAKGAGLPYSGRYRFVNTVSYLSVPHEVAPKEEALQCGECHLGGRGWIGRPWDTRGTRCAPAADFRNRPPSGTENRRMNRPERPPHGGGLSGNVR